MMRRKLFGMSLQHTVEFIAKISKRGFFPYFFPNLDEKQISLLLPQMQLHFSLKLFFHALVLGLSILSQLLKLLWSS